jgi:hypothetical protein
MLTLTYWLCFLCSREANRSTSLGAWKGPSAFLALLTGRDASPTMASA